MAEERLTCPKCGVPISEDDKTCKNCGANLIEIPPPSPPTAPKPEEAYVRRFSVWQRLSKLIINPSEAMKDIALAPEYGGIAVIIVIQSVLFAVGLSLIGQKFQFYGSNAAAVSSIFNSILAIAAVLGVFLQVIRWLVKSFLVKLACNSGIQWSFKVAASVTGYAYLADVVVGIVSLCISWFLIPTVSVDTTNLQTATQSLSGYVSHLRSLRFVYSLPVSLIAALWKSYLGGLGARSGTKEKCSLTIGFAVFFVLSLIGLLVSFVVNP
jgi:hypothetical protein